MTSKMRVKDLATEFGMKSANDLNPVMRDLGLYGRGPNSLLIDDEIDQIRTRVREQAAAQDNQKSAQAVIVRRRRRDTETPEERPAPAPARVVEKAVAPEPEPVQTPEPPRADPPAPRREPAPAQAARVVKPEEAPRTARIISMPEEPAPVTAPAPEPEPEPVSTAPEPAPVPLVEVPTQPSAPEAPQAVSPAQSAAAEADKPRPRRSQAEGSYDARDEVQPRPVEPRDAREAREARGGASESVVRTSVDGDEDEVDADGHRRGKGKKRGKGPKKREPVAGPQVRIISMPEPPKPAPVQVITPAPAPSAPSQPARPAYTPGDRRPAPSGPRPAPSGGRPAPSGPRPAPSGGRPAPSGGRPAPTPEVPAREEAAKKKQKRDKRVVEVNRSGSDDDARRSGGQAKKKKMSDINDRTGKIRGRRRRDERDNMADKGQTQPLKAAKRKIRIDEAIRVADMAHQMGIKSQEIIRILMGLGIMATINQTLDFETATLVAAEFEYEVEKVGFAEADVLAAEDTADTPDNLKHRPPVVTIMGHVDHGKTSLLDAIRSSNITSGEAGGITQHIGAYYVSVPKGELVFLDTPGHEAFTAMRARGAQVTDIVVLVVAADDGVMDQTREAVNHARAAGVPIVVAVNKIDKEQANPDRVKRELADLGLVPEEWGGETIYANVSAKKRIGLEELMEMILLQAEVLDLKANPDKKAKGHIIEAKLDKGRGPVATVLIQDGTVNQGDVFVCGVYAGKVRALFNDQGKKIKSAGPSMPVEVQGFDGVPEAGEEFIVLADEKMARRIAESRLAKAREKEMAKGTKVTLDSFLKAKAAGETKNLNLVLKADVQGSLQAITEALLKLSTPEVKVQVIHAGAGAITESDVMLAAASQAVVIGFNVRPSAKVREVADVEKIEIRFYDIIYNLVQEVRDAMSGMLSPIFRESYLGQAEVRETFSVPKVGMVAGCGVIDGKLTRNAGVRLLRDGVVMYTGKLASLKRFKDDAKEVLKGYECGVGLENFNDIKIGDVIEAFEQVQEQPTL